MAQIIRITSEALQQTIRRLLPSQQGFGEDLQASNVIQPIIDLTPTAEGSALPTDLARAMSFDSQSSFSHSGATTTTVVNTAGFHRVFGILCLNNAATNQNIEFQLGDGLSLNKKIFDHQIVGGATDITQNVPFDFIVFINSGEFLQLVGTATSFCDGTVRQVADLQGNIVNPSGFTPQ